jgi:pimeloyl-ACP methyl ester carboxylesterase
LKREPAGVAYSLRVNVTAIEKALESLGSLPEETLKSQSSIATLFIAGTQSHYITEAMRPSIARLFPNYQLEKLDAGHWVHAEKPVEFVELVENFLRK